VSGRGLVSVFPAPFGEETVSSPMYAFASFVKSQMAVAVWVYFWGIYLVPLVFMSVFARGMLVLLIGLCGII
jgi:hypothetical protein